MSSMVAFHGLRRASISPHRFDDTTDLAPSVLVPLRRDSSPIFASTSGSDTATRSRHPSGLFCIPSPHKSKGSEIYSKPSLCLCASVVMSALAGRSARPTLAGCPILCAFCKGWAPLLWRQEILISLPAAASFTSSTAHKSQSPESHSGLEMGINRRLHLQFYSAQLPCQDSSVISSDRAEGEGVEP